MSTSILNDAVSVNIQAAKRTVSMYKAQTLAEAMDATEGTYYSIDIEIIGQPMLMYGYLRRKENGVIEGLPMTCDFSDPTPDAWEVLDWNDWVVLAPGTPVEFVCAPEDVAVYRAVL